MTTFHTPASPPLCNIRESISHGACPEDLVCVTSSKEFTRAGLRTVAVPPDAQPYTTTPHKMGLRAGRNLDNIQELLAQTEGEEFR